MPLYVSSTFVHFFFHLRTRLFLRVSFCFFFFTDLKNACRRLVVFQYIYDLEIVVDILQYDFKSNITISVRTHLVAAIVRYFAMFYIVFLEAIWNDFLKKRAKTRAVNIYIGNDLSRRRGWTFRTCATMTDTLKIDWPNERARERASV